MTPTTNPPTPPQRFPLVGKIVALIGVFVVVTMFLQSVGVIVNERQGRLREAEQSVAASLASSQRLVGPMLHRACIESYEVTLGEGEKKKTHIERVPVSTGIAPASLDIQADARIEPRYRGIFKVNGYVLKARMTARFADGSALVPQATRPGSRITCEAPVLSVALGDSRGVRSASVTVDAAPAPVLPGTRHAAHRNGFHVAIAESYAGAKRPLAAEIALELVGTGGLDIAPVGAETRVALASDWPHPSFTGRFLPVERSVSDAGFKASWALNALATTAPEEARAGARVCGHPAGDGESQRSPRCVETFGVNFIDPVSPYTLADRATKYGLLFIALTFVGVAAVEVLRRVRVHPIQYLLVGAALSIFFLLLVSLSEHVSFAIAYAAAAGACTLLLAFYGSFVLRGARAGAAFGGAIAALFGALYLLLQLEQTALLIGSVMLFAVLAGIMVATRRIDWYALFERIRSDARKPAATAA